MAALRGEVFSWYKAWRGQTVTRVSELNLNVLGSRDSFGLRAKAMESYGILLFTISAAKKHASVLGNDVAQLAVERAQCIVDHVELLREHPGERPSRSCPEAAELVGPPHGAHQKTSTVSRPNTT